MSRLRSSQLRNLGKDVPNVTIVALSKYADIFESFNKNVEQFDEGFDRVLVRDGYLIQKTAHWCVVQGPKKFEMAGNANLGWKRADPEHDILYIGDDVRFLEHKTIERLRALAYADPKIGMISPMIVGGADNPLQTNPPQDRQIVYSDRYLALICTYIKRETINTVGYLDEDTFRGCYGNDDADYSRRVRNTGLKLAVAPQVKVQHGLDHRGTETFLRNIGGHEDDLAQMVAEHDKRYLAKWGDLHK
jgi:hypothetical protein